MGSIGLHIITDLRNKLYEQIQKQSLSFFAEHPTGLLMSRITNDVASVQTASAEAITALVKDGVMLISLLNLLHRLETRAYRAGYLFPNHLSYCHVSPRKMRKVTTSTQITMGTISSLLQETIFRTRIVKAFGMEKSESKRFAVENEKLFKYNMKAISVNAMSSPPHRFSWRIGDSRRHFLRRI